MVKLTISNMIANSLRMIKLLWKHHLVLQWSYMRL